MTSNLLSVRPEMYVVLYTDVTHHSIVCSCNPYYSKSLISAEKYPKIISKPESYYSNLDLDSAV